MGGEQQLALVGNWRIYARTLAHELVENGAIRSQEWQAAFENTPRHLFVPRFYRWTPCGYELVDGTLEDERNAWLEEVYSDAALSTVLDDAQASIPASSSTMPTLMALMLEALDLREGHRVLEIGTGTGYNAALLCARLGEHLVTTVEVDPELVTIARIALHTAGYRPTVSVGDGGSGHPRNAPYDRIIATCSVPQIPLPWIQQTHPGGFILATVPSGFGGGQVRLEVLPDGCAEGHFLPFSAYCPMIRGAKAAPPGLPQLVFHTSGEGVSRSTRVPRDIKDESLWFLAHLVFPTALQFNLQRDGAHDELRLFDAGDGSWVRVEEGSQKQHVVTQGGPRQLWDQLESVHELWLRLGKPDRDRYGLTITPDGKQRIWLDDPETEYSWELPRGRSKY